MKLYHLTSAQYAISNIALRRLKVARFGDLNDPFELLAAEQSDRKFRRGIKSWKDDYQKSKGLLCFSESWVNPVLWSHYADKHRGMALGFDVADIHVERVNYVKDRTQVRFENDDPEKGLSLSFVEELLRTKYVHWRYEGEWRALVSLNESTKEDGKYFNYFSERLVLKEVIVGPYCEIPFKHIKKLTEEIDKNIKTMKAKLGFKRFEVVQNLKYK